MSIKKKLKKMLQAQKQVEAESAPLPSQPEAVVPEVLEPVSANDPGQAMLELPPEHPLYRVGRSPGICPRPGSAWTRRASCRRRPCAQSLPGCGR